ncbi:MAG: hypothetical protein KDA28_03925, partial [Phycisphaerales bacterium]|nr:hypothetical protein [Phycisphaerales bacterium]
MWAYIVRKLLYNIPVYLSTILVLFLVLRVNDPVRNYLGKNATEESRQAYRQQMGLDQPVIVQYGRFMWQVV